jgi:DNA invertase Pin-like site-specific DNA recombinase
MSSSGNTCLHLEGTGASYLRVSGDRQEVERQLASRLAFESRHGVKISTQHQYEDHMPRDLAAQRPDFQRMLAAVRAGLLQWIYIDHIDRLGFKDEDELVEVRSVLRRAGCRLIDSRDDDWTSRGLLAFIKVGLAGHASREEQVTKSRRALGGMVEKARAGEWQGGAPKLGFDVACFERGTDKELWRVVWQGRSMGGYHPKKRTKKGKPKAIYHHLRLRVYPDGREERLDGNVTFRQSKDYSGPRKLNHRLSYSGGPGKG